MPSQMYIQITKLGVGVIASPNCARERFLLGMRPQMIKELEYTFEHFSARTVLTNNDQLLALYVSTPQLKGLPKNKNYEILAARKK